jgi:hypothetical protein
VGRTTVAPLLALAFFFVSADAAETLRITRITGSTDDRDTAAPLSLPPGVRLLCRAEVNQPVAEPGIRWQLLRNGNPVNGAILAATGLTAAYRLPDLEGAYEVTATVGAGSSTSVARLPLEIKRRRYPVVPALDLPENAGAAIQRTMSLLATSTPDHRKPVRILFYGQSLTKQDWARTVANDLRKRFPYADLTIANRSIGGYSSPYLIRTLPHDVYSFYPDLIIFHDYGDQQLYEQIISNIRSHTTAEILLQSDRASPPPAKGPDNSEWHERHSIEWLPDLARRYGLEWADLWRPWKAYLKENNLTPADVLRDGAHYTLQGDDMVAQITSRYLIYRPELASRTESGMVRDYEVSRDVEWKNGRWRLQFEGNRVDAIGGWDNPFHGGEAEVLIDGKHPSEIPDLYSVTLPSDTYAVDWPAVNRVGHEKPLLKESWVLRVTGNNADDSQWHFEVVGSHTGPDGEGVSTEKFVSRSGRVVIEPGDWGVKRAFDLNHKRTPIGFEVHWSVEGEFTDSYREQRMEDPSREYSQTLALGLPNGSHTLEMVAKGAFPPVIRAVRVYRPPHTPQSR